MKNIMNIVNSIIRGRRSKTNIDTMNGNVADGNTIILSKDEGKICCPFLRTYILSLMRNKVNLKMRFSEDEAKSILAGTGTVTKHHNENGRNYQVKVTSTLPPTSKEPVFMLQVRELLSDEELAKKREIK